MWLGVFVSDRAAFFVFWESPIMEGVVVGQIHGHYY